MSYFNDLHQLSVVEKEIPLILLLLVLSLLATALLNEVQEQGFVIDKCSGISLGEKEVALRAR